MFKYSILFFFIFSIEFFRNCNGKYLENQHLNKIPDYLKICHKSDANLNECVKNTIEQLRPKLIEGIPELQIPSCEPLLIPKINLRQDAGAMTINSEYTNILVSGPSKFHLKSVRVDPIKDRFRLVLWFPELKMTANYNIKGKLLMMPLHGQGKCSGNYTDVDAVAAVKGVRYIKNNEEYLKVKDLFVEFNIGGASIKLDDLFNGDPDLGQTMNRFLNEHWKSIAGEIRPELENVIADILHEVADKLFNEYSLQQLLPE